MAGKEGRSASGLPARGSRGSGDDRRRVSVWATAWPVARWRSPIRDGSGLGSVRVSAGFGFLGFGFGVGFSPTVFKFGFGFGFGFWFPPVDIQWISEINHLELKLMFYNMLMITCLLRLLNLLKVDS